MWHAIRRRWATERKGYPVKEVAAFSLAVARELERRGIDLYRAKYGLLSADGNRAIREPRADSG